MGYYELLLGGWRSHLQPLFATYVASLISDLVLSWSTLFVLALFCEPYNELQADSSCILPSRESILSGFLSTIPYWPRSLRT